MEANAKEKTFSLEWHKGAFKTTHSVLFQMEMHTMVNQDSRQKEGGREDAAPCYACSGHSQEGGPLSS